MAGCYVQELTYVPMSYACYVIHTTCYMITNESCMGRGEPVKYQQVIALTTTLLVVSR